MKLITLTVTILFLSSISAIAYEDCDAIYKRFSGGNVMEGYQSCRIANALEVIAQKMR